MKKLLLLSLLFSALVFQSCKKISSDKGEDLVPILFSKAEITTSPVAQTKSGVAPIPIDALVLGSLGGQTEDKNDWTTIYGSTSIDYANTVTPEKKNFAIGNLELYNSSEIAGGVANENFNPVVAYPKDVELNPKIYIKALAPFRAIKGKETLITNVNNDEGAGLSVVTFQIDGHDDVLATKVIGDDLAETQGIGSRDVAEGVINLTFEHLLTKINFKVKFDNVSAKEYWGEHLESIVLKGVYTEFTCSLSNNTVKLLDNPVRCSTGFTLLSPMKITATEGVAGHFYVFPETTSLDNVYTIILKTKKSIVNEQGGPTDVIVQSEPAVLTSLALNKGAQHDITITLKDSPKMSFTVLLVDWGDEIPLVGPII